MIPRLVYICTLMLLVGACSEAPSLEVVARLQQAPGNITVTPQKRIVVSLHQFYQPQWRVAEWADGQLRPFPNERIAKGADPDVKLHSVLGIQSDSQGVVWMLDNGMRGDATPSLVGWDTRNNQLQKVIHLPAPITPDNAFVNDLAVDETHNRIYITDPAGGDNAALIVVDLTTGAARRILQGHASVVAEAIDLVIGGDAVEIKQPNGEIVRPHVGANPIALDAADEWLYYGPMHGNALYRIKTADLVNAKLTSAALAERVEKYAAKPICDGISMDKAGNIYISDLQENAIGVIDSERRYRLLVQDGRLSWPDALSFGPQDRLYTVSNQLHRSAVLNAGKRTAQAPFFIFSFEPLAGGITGR